MVIKIMARLKYILILFLISFYGCSGSAPEIGQLIWQINYKQAAEGSSVYTSLSIFILTADKDGIEDVDSVYLINDDAELFWKLDRESWTIKLLEGNNWIGSNSLQMNDGSSLPSGLYRVVVIDKAGERDSREFNIIKDMLYFSKERSFPELYIDSDVAVISEYSENTLWIYDEKMVILKNININSGEINLDIINNDTANRARWISLYSFDSDRGTGYIRGPYSLQGNN